MEQKLVSEVAKIKGVYIVTPAQLLSTYPVENYYDPHTDELGHIPYTPTFFSALGTNIARQIHALKSNPYKVIVLDCDQTLWKGVCGEDGPEGVTIDPPRQILQELIVAQQKAGKLICLCSKNEESDVWAVFAAHQSMPLRKEHLVSWRINWQSKSENLKALAQELQLGLDSFIFIDDNPVECAEVQANSPEVLTIQLPQEAEDIPQFLQHIWAFDQLKVTQEDRARTELYRQNVQREKTRQAALTFEDFLTGLGLEVEISALAPEQIERVAQLTQRTNQFNLTTRRRSAGEIQQLWASGELECLVVQVKDRFGDYGLVGVMLFELVSETLKVDSLLLSCRVLGRGVEHQILARLGAIARERRCSWVYVPYIPSQKNQPALDFFESVGEEYQQQEGQNRLFRFPVEAIAKLTFKPGVEQARLGSDLSGQKATALEMQLPSKSGLYQRIATELYDAQQVLQVVKSQKQHQRPELEGVFVAPRNPVEEMVAGMWRDLLKLDQVGIYDNFFKLGGNSLLATQVISRLREAFSVELPLHQLFESPTVAELSSQIEAIRQAGSEVQLPAIKPVPRDQELLLSFGQQRLWLLAQLEEQSTTYNEPAAVRLSGPLNQAALEQSLREVVRRHEVLRTTFKLVNGSPVQIIAPQPTLTLPVVTLESLLEEEQATEVQRLVTREQELPFDLATGSLLRVRLLKLAAESHVLLVTMHHIVSDGWSMGVFIREVIALYQAFSNELPSSLQELPIQYADFAHWQRQWLKGEVFETQLNYWKQQLARIPPVLELPTDRPRPPVQTFAGNIFSWELNQDLTQQLKTLSQHSGATLFMTLLAAFVTLLSRYSGQEDIVVGSPIANRNRSEVESLIGFFVNTLVLRTDLKDNPSFSELLARVRQVALDAYTHQDVPFEQLVEELQPERNLSHTPLFQVMFVLQNAPMEKLELPNLTLTPLEMKSITAKFDLTLSMMETEQGLQGMWEYNSDLFDPQTIARMVGNFQNLLEGIVANPEQRISDLPLLSEAERHQLLVEWNDTQAEYPQDKCIHQLFEEQVERTPEAVAVVFEQEQLTYGKLNKRANQLAHYLQSLGVGPEVLVGICVERSIDMVVGLLGILKAGGGLRAIRSSLSPRALSLHAVRFPGAGTIDSRKVSSQTDRA